MATTTPDWNPETYARFRGLRLRPALDLLAQVGEVPAGDIVDLGCGDGAVGPALRLRWPDRRLVGIDASPAMLAGARTCGAYDALIEADAGTWQPAAPPALIFSNALLHWLPDHATLLPRLAGLLAPGGTLAVQVPGQHDAPSHALLRQVARDLRPDLFDFSAYVPPVAMPADYARMLAPLGTVSAWETTYLQRLAPVLAPVEDGHPVRRFTQSTAMRPFVEKLGDDAADFVADYDAALARVYPPEPDGSVLFPFRRVFFVLTV
ncbi:MAG: methyltransferase domain-containing protein [Limimaricola sp.]|uniref:methyltransferase domain-containing protein n=1 Tax=Limimaricola sp. TaxID=2211665 RepID=UPI001D6FA740|nr:methyltransferase domain-containing protein [Limimaricola sp.]MBI1416068.1 methyltransferase domain-containing protein [Limimaricola sp.]